MNIFKSKLTMTEDQIEAQVSRMIDRADHAFMTGKITQNEYDVRQDAIARWADEMYQRGAKMGADGKLYY